MDLKPLPSPSWWARLRQDILPAVKARADRVRFQVRHLIRRYPPAPSAGTLLAVLSDSADYGTLGVRRTSIYFGSFAGCRTRQYSYEYEKDGLAITVWFRLSGPPKLRAMATVEGPEGPVAIYRATDLSAGWTGAATRAQAQSLLAAVDHLYSRANRKPAWMMQRIL